MIYFLLLNKLINNTVCRWPAVPLRSWRVYEGVPTVVQPSAASQGSQRPTTQVIQHHS